MDNARDLVTKQNFMPTISMFLVMIVALCLVGWVAFSVIKSVGERLFDFENDRVVATFTPAEECLVDPGGCHIDDLSRQDERWDRLIEDDE